MSRIISFIVLPVLMLVMSGNLSAQQPDTTVAGDTLKNREEVPAVLKKFVKKYKEQVQADSAMSKDLESGSSDEGPALNNLVMDNTLSKIGHDFYETFYENWDPPQTDRHFTIYINERPSPGIGNMVMIKINYEKIFRGKLVPRQSKLKKIARRAVKRSENYIANYKKMKQQLGEDLKGTGIY